MPVRYRRRAQRRAECQSRQLPLWRNAADGQRRLQSALAFSRRR